MNLHSDENQQQIVCLDGGAGVGKSTLGITLARSKNLQFIDSGIFYRLATYLAYLNNIELDNGALIANKIVEAQIEFGLDTSGKEPNSTLLLNNKDITSLLFQKHIDDNVSIVSKLPEVREAIVMKLRKMAQNKPTLITGRDIGTVVFPESKLKMFITVSQEIRAKRRLLQKNLDESHFDEVLQNIKLRDDLDSTRKIAPLKPANDAVIIMNDGKIDENLKIMMGLCEKRLK